MFFIEGERRGEERSKTRMTRVSYVLKSIRYLN